MTTCEHSLHMWWQFASDISSSKWMSSNGVGTYKDRWWHKCWQAIMWVLVGDWEFCVTCNFVIDGETKKHDCWQVIESFMHATSQSMAELGNMNVNKQLGVLCM